MAKSTGGFVVLLIATFGMLCYACWRFFEGLYGLRVDPKGKTALKIVNGYVIPFTSCAIYISYAIGNLIAIVNGRRDNGGDDLSAKMAENILGKIFLQLASIILFLVAIAWAVMLVQRKFKQDVDMDRLNELRWGRMVFYATAILGTFGRILLFCLLAILLSRTVYDSSIRDGGFGTALDQLRSRTIGKVFIVFIGVLLVIFGLYSCLLARYKQFLPYKPHLRTDMDRHLRLSEESGKDKGKHLHLNLSRTASIA